MSLFGFAAGVAMGLVIAAPLGPVNIIAMRAALQRGIAGGLAAGLGAVAADTAFACVAGFGLQRIADFFNRYASPIGLIGGALLVLIGVRTAVKRLDPSLLAEEPAAPAPDWLLRRAALTFTTTITNPGALIGVFAVFGAMAAPLRLAEGTANAATAVSGFACGGLLWWLGLSVAVDRLRGRLSAKMLGRINRIMGILIAAFGFALLLEALGY